MRGYYFRKFLFYKKKRPAYEAGLSLCVRFANYFRKRMKI